MRQNKLLNTSILILSVFFLVGTVGCGKKAKVKRVAPNNQKPTVTTADQGGEEIPGPESTVDVASDDSQDDNENKIAEVSSNSGSPKVAVRSVPKTSSNNNQARTTSVRNNETRTTEVSSKPRASQSSQVTQVIEEGDGRRIVLTKGSPAGSSETTSRSTKKRTIKLTKGSPSGSSVSSFPSNVGDVKMVTTTTKDYDGKPVTVQYPAVRVTSKSKPFKIINGKRVYEGEPGFDRKPVAPAPQKPAPVSNQSRVVIKYMDDLGSRSRGQLKSISDNRDQITLKPVRNVSDVIDARNQSLLISSYACRADLQKACVVFNGKKSYFVGSVKNSSGGQSLRVDEIQLITSEVPDDDAGCFDSQSFGCDQQWAGTLKKLSQSARANSGPVVYSRFKNESQVRSAVDFVRVSDVLKYPTTQKGLGSEKATDMFVNNALKYKDDFFKVAPGTCSLKFAMKYSSWKIILAKDRGKGLGAVMCDGDRDGEAEDITLVRVSLNGIGVGIGVQVKTDEFIHKWFKIDHDVVFTAKGLSFPKIKSKDLANCINVGLKGGLTVYKYNAQAGLGIGASCTDIPVGGELPQNALVFSVLYGYGSNGKPLTLEAHVEAAAVTTKDRSDEF